MLKKAKLLQSGIILLAIATLYPSIINFISVMKNSSQAERDSGSPVISSNIETIQAAHLFGSSGGVELQGDMDRLLNDTLELKGVSESSGQGYTGAYIAQKGQTEILYRIGDALPGGIGTLENVAADSVMVKKDGKAGKLYFIKQENMAPAMPDKPIQAIPMQ